MRLAVLTLALLTASPSFAVLNLDDVLQRMDQAQQSVQDISFSFVMHARQGQFQGRSAGDVQLKKPNLLRINLTAPERQTILTDGSALWIYSPKQKQVLKGHWTAWVDHSHFPLVLMNFIGAFGARRWQDDYLGTLEAHEDQQYKIRLVSRRPNAVPPVVLWVSDESFLPTRGDLVDTQYSAQVRIKAAHTNSGLKDPEFEPRFPSGIAEVPVTF